MHFGETFLNYITWGCPVYIFLECFKRMLIGTVEKRGPSAELISLLTIKDSPALTKSFTVFHFYTIKLK